MARAKRGNYNAPPGNYRNERTGNHVEAVNPTQAAFDAHREMIDNLDVAAGGVKHDTGKVRFDLMPPEVEIAVARVLTKGAVKYADRNWERGIRYGRCYAAARRHMADFWAGNSHDQENGEHVLANAICMLTFLLAYELRKDEKYAEFDDRPEDTSDVPMTTAEPLQSQ